MFTNTKPMFSNTKPSRVLIGAGGDFDMTSRGFTAAGDQNARELFAVLWDPSGRAIRNRQLPNDLRPSENTPHEQNEQNGKRGVGSREPGVGSQESGARCQVSANPASSIQHLPSPNHQSNIINHQFLLPHDPRFPLSSSKRSRTQPRWLAKWENR
jgi:hypothetical protein